MLARIFGAWLSVENPRGRFIMNISLFFILISFAYFINALTRPAFDTTDKLISGVKHYGIYLLLVLWQYSKWIKKGRKVVAERSQVKETVVEAKEPSKIDPNKASFKVHKRLESYIRA